jgi:Fe-S cluster biosynthesis and repair protein YggX
MSDRTVYCVKLKTELEALPAPPYPGELGERIYNEVSLRAWDLWLQRQTMLINEYRLSLIDTKARKYLEDEMEKFLFDDTDTPPPGYTEQD